MNKVLALIFALTCSVSFAQEKLIPLKFNPYIGDDRAQTKTDHSIDSTFQSYTYSNLDLPVWDDFSVNNFVDYNVDFSSPNASSIQYFHLMNETNTLPLNENTQLCNSLKSRVDTVVVIAGIVETNSTNFTNGTEVYINNLTSIIKIHFLLNILKLNIMLD